MQSKKKYDTLLFFNIYNTNLDLERIFFEIG